MALFTLRRLASVQGWLAITAFFALCHVIGLQIFEQKIDCKLHGPGKKSEVDESCMISLYYPNSNDASQIRHYQDNQMIWIFLLVSAIVNGVLCADFHMTRVEKPSNGKRPNDSQSTPKKSGFTRAATLRYVIPSFLYLIFSRNWFQLLTMPDRRSASFAIAWLQNFSDGKPLLARQVTCQLRQYRLFEPVTTTTATCRLPMNSHFEFIYLVLWFWFALLAVVNLLVLLDCLLLAFSSTRRLKRLSALLKGVDRQKIFELAEDADAFFKIECWAGETVELKGRRLLNAAVREPSDSP